MEEEAEKERGRKRQRGREEGGSDEGKKRRVKKGLPQLSCPLRDLLGVATIKG